LFCPHAVVDVEFFSFGWRVEGGVWGGGKGGVSPEKNDLKLSFTKDS